MDTQLIAKLMNADLEEVQAGIASVERWKAGNSLEIVSAAMHEQVLIAIEPIGRTLVSAQEAQRLVSPAQFDKEGKLLRDAVYVPDHDTQIKAVEAVARVVESVKDKGPGVQVNVGGQHLHANGAGRSFEERLRMRREAKGMNSNQNVIDANAALALRDGSREEEEDDDELDEELEDEGDGLGYEHGYRDSDDKDEEDGEQAKV